MATEKKTTEEEKVKTSKNEKKPYVFAVGRRREAVARVRLYEDIKTGVVWKDAIVKKGEVYINEKPANVYFSLKAQEGVYLAPLKAANVLDRFITTIRVEGGGMTGQLDATVLGIARALEKIDPQFRPILKKKGFLTRDSRTRQRRNVGMGGKARRKKQSPKR